MSSLVTLFNVFYILALAGRKVRPRYILLQASINPNFPQKNFAYLKRQIFRALEDFVEVGEVRKEVVSSREKYYSLVNTDLYLGKLQG